MSEDRGATGRWHWKDWSTPKRTQLQPSTPGDWHAELQRIAMQIPFEHARHISQAQETHRPNGAPTWHSAPSSLRTRRDHGQRYRASRPEHRTWSDRCGKRV